MFAFDLKNNPASQGHKDRQLISHLGRNMPQTNQLKSAQHYNWKPQDWMKYNNPISNSWQSFYIIDRMMSSMY